MAKQSKVEFTTAVDIDAIILDHCNEDKKTTATPYQQFSKLSSAGPDDPHDLAAVYNKINTFGQGFFDVAIKMMEGLIGDGFESQATHIGSELTQKTNVPGVVIYTGVIERYATMGRTLDALKTYKRMNNSGVLPNGYTYRILILALAADPDPLYLDVASKYMLEMISIRGMMPGAVTYTAVFKAYARRGRIMEGRELLKEMKAKGFVAVEKDVRNVIKGRKGPIVKNLFKILGF